MTIANPYTAATRHFIPPDIFAELNNACALINHAFGVGRTFLVGSALERATFRDIDVRTISDLEYKPEMVNLLSQTVSAWLTVRVTRPVDFKIRTRDEVKSYAHKFAFPLGIKLAPAIVGITRVERTA